ncbi:gephyrin [Plakobranchus ocellatus]|uniref:Gephyrin n=1 Tax=Plakobranchus ocellatus TaxID=259542 RepID=A0AAV3YGX4_9GAST|nr:gephyrin [Plakobranchus ocellatus]
MSARRGGSTYGKLPDSTNNYFPNKNNAKATADTCVINTNCLNISVCSGDGSNDTGAENERTAKKAQMSSHAAVDTSSSSFWTSSHRPFLLDTVAAFAPPGCRMILTCLVVWGYCLSNCFGLLLSPEPYPAGITKTTNHRSGMVVATGFLGRKHKYINDKIDTASTDMEPHTAYVKLSAKLEPSGQNSRLLVPFNSLLSLGPHRKRTKILDRNKNPIKSQFEPKRSGFVYKHPSKLTSSALQHNQSDKLASQTSPPPQMHSVKNNYMVNLQDRTRLSWLPSGVRNMFSQKFLKRNLTHHIGLPKPKHSPFIKKDRIVKSNTKQLNSYVLKNGRTRHKASNVKQTQFKGVPSQISDATSFKNIDRPAKTQKDNGDDEAEENFDTEETLRFLIQETAQKMQNRIDYLMSLDDEHEVTDDDINFHSKGETSFSDESMDYKDTAIPSYRNDKSNFLNNTKVAMNTLSPQKTDQHLRDLKTNYFGHYSNKVVSSKAYKQPPNKDHLRKPKVKLEEQHHKRKAEEEERGEEGEEGEKEEKNIYERDVMNAVLKAIASGKIPEDVHFWRNVSNLLDSTSYLSRTRRSSYWRRRTRTRNSRRFEARMRARFTIRYDHVRPCRRRDRYYCLNGGTCVFVVALDIKTCRVFVNSQSTTKWYQAFRPTVRPGASSGAQTLDRSLPADIGARRVLQP